ncbi:uncharacterized protein LOC121405362 [Drosophila obscura]|uniref:uncharacterized protein LOC121405362 n=1 Tax=Drosophila obscura TaxID=7282 RepID=UPI001BB1E058|nr:uncharacterized protein LOC121405362 [Drosophila obscura]
MLEEHKNSDRMTYLVIMDARKFKQLMEKTNAKQRKVQVIDGRKEHTQRRFKLWSEGTPDRACWVKIGRSGDVRLGVWFNVPSLQNQTATVAADRDNALVPKKGANS